MNRETGNSKLETGEPNAQLSTLDDDGERLERWCYWTGRIAEAASMIALSLAVIVLAVIGWEAVKLYRSLPPGEFVIVERRAGP